jgi:hypothetical protein
MPYRRPCEVTRSAKLKYEFFHITQSWRCSHARLIVGWTVVNESDPITVDRIKREHFFHTVGVSITVVSATMVLKMVLAGRPWSSVPIQGPAKACSFLNATEEDLAVECPGAMVNNVNNTNNAACFFICSFLRTCDQAKMSRLAAPVFRTCMGDHPWKPANVKEKPSNP